MYGDVGHGVLMSIAAFFMVLFEKKIASKKSQNEVMEGEIFVGVCVCVWLYWFNLFSVIIGGVKIFRTNL